MHYSYFQGQDLHTQNMKPRSPLAPLKKGESQKPPIYRGLGDLLCVSPKGNRPHPTSTAMLCPYDRCGLNT